MNLSLSVGQCEGVLGFPRQHTADLKHADVEPLTKAALPVDED